LQRWSGFVLIGAAHAIEDRYARAAAEAGVSLRDFVLMAEIARYPGIFQSTLARRVGLSRSRVSEQLLVLSTAGYVSRDMDQRDLRRRMIWLSSDAHRLVEEITAQLDRIDATWLKPLDYPRERATFTAALRRLPPALPRRLAPLT
jgi:DNA-binding MarR family transcriptional regulator